MPGVAAAAGGSSVVSLTAGATEGVQVGVKEAIPVAVAGSSGSGSASSDIGVISVFREGGQQVAVAPVAILGGSALAAEQRVSALAAELRQMQLAQGGRVQRE